MRRGRSRHHADARWARITVIVGLACFVAAVYVIVVVCGDAILGRDTAPSLPLSVLATTIVALAFEWVRRSLEAGAVRMFSRGDGVSPYDVLSHFSQTVTGGYATEELPDRMAKLLAEGTDAEWAQVWLVVQDRLTLAASWPPGTDTVVAPPPQPAPDARDLTAVGRRAVTVHHGGRIYGIFRLQERHEVPLSSVEERLFTGLAAQAGLVLRLVGLRAELAARYDELAARAAELRLSRDRLIAAQDNERRLLERDIHDGAQQHLVALAVNLRVVEAVARKDPARAASILAAQAEAAHAAIDTLSELSRGMYPRHLADSGLGTALRGAFVGSVVPVVVEADNVRLPAPIEAALYFFASEAVQNAAKHANASLITALLQASNGTASLTVADDGIGFAPEQAVAAGGSGLANMRDRVEAVSGVVSFDFASGPGTRVTATVAV
jgi:signal transduction histidine kinase